MTPINWKYPEPRRGLAGAFDQFVGPGYTRAELILEMTIALGSALAMALFARFGHLGWNSLQTIVAILLAFDLSGGVVTNATSTAKRWYHRKGQGYWQHMLFEVINVTQILLVAWLFRSDDWLWAFTFFIYLIASSTITLLVPLYLQRPVALALFAGALLIDLYAFAPTPGLEWVIPVYFLKLLVSNLLHEEPYRPAGERA